MAAFATRQRPCGAASAVSPREEGSVTPAFSARNTRPVVLPDPARGLRLPLRVKKPPRGTSEEHPIKVAVL